MFKHGNNWEWMWLLAAVALIGMAGEIWRRRALGGFAGERAAASMRRTSRRNTVVLTAELLAMLLLVAALADPRWGLRIEQIPEPQVQLVFAVDVSRSMSAEDVRPSRLDYARALVANCLNSLDGECVALVDFAGNARTAAPLTRNYAEIEAKLDTLLATERLIGGSELMSAFQSGRDAFLDRIPGEKVLVVLTDGEDHGTADVAQIAAVANESGCRTLIVGIGDPVAGARIPVEPTASGPQYLTYKGETVVSRRNDALLKQLAALTDGVYVATNGNTFDLAAAYRDRIALTLDSALRSRPMRVGVARFPWFLAAAVLLLLCSCWCQLERHADQSPDKAAGAGWNSSTSARVLVAMAALTVGLGASSDDVVRRANREFRAGRWDEAIAGYERAATLHAESAMPVYNQAVAYYRSGDRVTARAKLSEMLAIADARFAARAEFLLGNCDYADVIAGGLTKDQSIAQLQSAIGHYRRALAVRPDWDDPRINIELAQTLIEEIKHAAEMPQSSQESGEDGKADNGDRDTSAQRDTGPNQTSANSKQQAKSPHPRQDGSASGEKSSQQSNGADGSGRNPQSSGGNSGGSKNPQQSGGGNSSDKSPADPPPDQNDVQKKLDKIMQQARRREANRKEDDGRQSVEVDKNW